MADLIDRQAVIDVMYKHSGLFDLYVPYEFYEMKKEIRKLPSAQPDVPDTNVGDSISRQAAIEVLNNYDVDAPDYMSVWAQKLLEAFKGDIRELISELPSAQPEIIRCKDCLMHGVCRFERGLGVDGYCSQAERR